MTKAMGIEVDGKRATLSNWKTLPNPPKTWKRVKTAYHNIGNLYNPGYMVIYKARDNSLRFEMYRDGSFYAYYGRIEFNS